MAATREEKADKLQNSKNLYETIAEECQQISIYGLAGQEVHSREGTRLYYHLRDHADVPILGISSRLPSTTFVLWLAGVEETYS